MLTKQPIFSTLNSATPHANTLIHSLVSEHEVVGKTFPNSFERQQEKYGKFSHTFSPPLLTCTATVCFAIFTHSFGSKLNELFSTAHKCSPHAVRSQTKTPPKAISDDSTLDKSIDDDDKRVKSCHERTTATT